MLTKEGYISPMKIVPHDMQPSVRQVKGRKVPKAGLWTQHDCDLDPSVYGKRHRTRGPTAAKAQYGLANELNFTVLQFMRGFRLYVQRDGTDDWRVVNVITDETIGYAPCHDALAYRIAAARVGVTLEVYHV